MQATYGLNGTAVILGIMSASLVGAVGAGVHIPVLGNGRAAFFTLAWLGAMLCGQAFKVLPQAYPHGWLNPFTLAGIALGVANLFLIGAAVFHVRLPLIPDARAATLVLGAAMAAKVILTFLRAALA